MKAIPIGLFLLSALPAAAEDPRDAARLSLLPGWQAENGNFVAAVRVDLAPGWKTYWREPGAAGIAPEFDWSASRNVAHIQQIWPTPTIFDDDGERTIGYQDHMTVPVIVTPEDPSETVSLSLTAYYGVCKEICVPAHGVATVDIAQDSQQNELPILTAMEAAPISADQAGINGTSCRVAPDGDDFSLQVSVGFPHIPTDPAGVIVELGNTDTWVADITHSAQGQTLTVDADIMYFGDVPYELDAGALRLTLLNRDGAIDIRGCDL